MIETSCEQFNDCNLLINPKLITNREKRKEQFLQLIDVIYDKLKYFPSKNNTNFLHSIYYFSREESLKENNKTSNNLISKIYSIFPNINFELTQIKNLSFSNTNLNKYLVSRNNSLNEINEYSNYKSGFFTMSQNHRLIALHDDINDYGGVKNSENLKQIIFGIWLNFKEEKTTPKKIDLDSLLEKNKNIIYQKCLEFIILSDKIETIYSPSPDESIFLLVIFYHGIQCHYEVKVTPNEEEKNTDDSILSNFNNNWLITKKKIEININELNNNNFEYNLKNEIESIDKINTVTEFLSKKIGTSQKSFFSKSSNTNNLIHKKENKEYIIKHNLNTYRRNLNEIFENSVNLSLDDSDDFYNLYNLPMPINSNIKTEGNNINEDNKKRIQQKISGISYASTSIQSGKPSLLSSKNSNINNITNDIISHPYASLIFEQGEKIKKLQNQVDRIENTLQEVLNELDGKNYKEKNKTYNVQKKNKFKRIKNLNDDLNKNNYKLVDQSIKIPHIVYKDLSKEDEE